MALLLLHVVSYAGALFAFLFVTLSLASGLLYIAEVIEEHSRAAKWVGQRIIYTVIGAHIAFCVIDRLPWHLSLLGIFCHIVYLQNFSRTWPFISLTSVSFLSSCILVIVDHFAWFFYFADRARDHPHHYRGQRQPYRSAWDQPRNRSEEPLSFMDVATFFGFCVWLVPFFLFLSLSANDNVLPSSDQGLSTPQIKAGGQTINFQSAPRTSILKAVLEPVVNLVPARMIGYRGSRSQREGLIASPSRSQPPSPTHGSQSFFGGPAPQQGMPSWQGYQTPPPPMSPNAAGGSQMGIGSPGTPTLSPKNSYSAFAAQAANVRPAHIAPPPNTRRANTSPGPSSRLSQSQLAEDAFGPTTAEPDGIPVASSYAGNQVQTPGNLTKRKVG